MWHPTFRFLLANVFFFVVFVAYENTYTPASAGVVGSLLINGDFENGLTGWNLDGSPDLVSGRIGGSALRSIQERTADQTPNWRGIRQQVPVTAGQPYEFSVWVKDVNSLGSHHMKIIWRDVLNQEIGVDYDNYWDQEPSSEWVEKVQKFVARPFAVTAEIVLWHGVTDNNGTHINVTGSTLLIDDVLFTPLQCTSEHICNPNFEDGLNFWRNTEKATVVQGRSGNGIQINNESGGNVHVFQVLSGVFQKDKTYQASVWCKALEGQECSIFFGDEGSGYENTDHLTILGNDDWQHLTVRVALTKDEVMSLYLYSRTTGSGVIYDDVQVQELHCAVGVLCNSGFEQAMDYWSGGISTNVILPGRTDHWAIKSVQKRQLDKAPVWEGIAQRIQVLPDRSYNYTAWLKWDNATNVHMKIDWYDINNKQILPSNYIVDGQPESSPEWSQKGGQVSVPSNAAFANLIIWHGVKAEKNVTASTLWIDDVTFEPVSVPTTQTPISILTPTATLTPTPTDISPAPQKPLVLIYAVLDNNLQYQWGKLVNNVEKGVNQNIDVRMLIDGPKSNDSVIYKPMFDRDDRCPHVDDLDCFERYSANNSNLWQYSEDTASSETLSNFLKESLILHPNPSQIVLVLIGHGSGWSANVLPGQPGTWRDQNGGFLWDDHPNKDSNKAKSLSIKDLGIALQQFKTKTGRGVDLLYLDGCSMGMVEVAYELRNHTRFLLASPNTKWASFRYDRLLPVLAEEAGDSRTVGEHWLALEAKSLQGSEHNYPFTYVLLDLAKMELLAQKVSSLSIILKSYLPDQKDTFLNAFGTTDHYESDYNGRIDELDAYSDLFSFTNQVKQRFSTYSAIRDAVIQLHDVLPQVVITKTHQNGAPPSSEQDDWSWNEYGGLGIYLPLALDEERREQFYTADHLSWVQDTAWDEFLVEFRSDQVSAAQTPRPLATCNNTIEDECEGLARPLVVYQVYLPMVSQ